MRSPKSQALNAVDEDTYTRQDRRVELRRATPVSGRRSDHGTTIEENQMINIGEQIPDLELEAFHADDVQRVGLSSYRGKWLVVLF